MWMIDPRQMCRQHLLGEHVELHMLIGSLKRKKSIAGFIERDQLEPLSVHARHDALVDEMIRRGYQHNSPATEAISAALTAYLPREHRLHRIDKEAAQRDLHGRCGACRAQAALAKVRQRRRRHHMEEEACTPHSQSI